MKRRETRGMAVNGKIKLPTANPQYRATGCRATGRRAEHERSDIHWIAGHFHAQRWGARAHPTAPGAGAVPSESVKVKVGRIAMFVLLLVLLPGCATRNAFVGSRPFDFQKDTFAYPNDLVWEYH